jgi:hypothetical protein
MPQSARLQPGASFDVLQMKVSASGHFDMLLTKTVLIVPVIYLPNFSAGGSFHNRKRPNEQIGRQSFKSVWA